MTVTGVTLLRLRPWRNSAWTYPSLFTNWMKTKSCSGDTGNTSYAVRQHVLCCMFVGSGELQQNTLDRQV